MEGLVSFTLLQIVMILSIIVILSADVESTNVICPHDLYILAIFLEYGFCGHSTECLQLWKTWKSQGIYYFWKTQGI